VRRKTGVRGGRGADLGDVYRPSGKGGEDEALGEGFVSCKA
jgi:hypothetical protein